MMALAGEARRLGVTIHLCHVEDGYDGLYDDRSNAVYVRIDLTMPQIKEVLAHELSHAYFRHRCSTGPNERIADRRAAQLLVDVEEYVRAERIDPEPAAIAEELGVTEKVIRDYQQHWLSGRAPRF